MKRIAETYADRAEVIAISVDTNEGGWKASVSKNGLDWINICELKEWNGKIVEDYYIYATPTIYVLDKDLGILSKPGGVRELQEYMKGTSP